MKSWKRSEESNSFPDDPEPTWSADPGELRRQLRETGLEAFEDRILEGTEPAVLLRWMAPSEHKSPESRIGGRPDLPPDAAWPEHAGAPMIFLCQVRLAELTGLPGTEVLPDRGVLSFWCADTDEIQGIDAQDRGASQVFWFDDEGSLSTRDEPEGLPVTRPLRARALELRSILSPPDWGDPLLDELGLSLDTRHRALIERWYPRQGKHQILGKPVAIQGNDLGLVAQFAEAGEPLTEIESPELTHLRDGSAEWRLLLQVDTDYDGIEVQWADDGIVYVLIRDQDLRQHRFDRTWMLVESG